jgi:mRNA interferase MazF
MKTGDIVLLNFPFAEVSHKKVRPATVVCETKDKYKDLVVCAISSVMPEQLSENDVLLQPDTQNNLRAVSILKVDRIVTALKQDIIKKIGELGELNLETFKNKFKKLIS